MHVAEEAARRIATARSHSLGQQAETRLKPGFQGQTGEMASRIAEFDWAGTPLGAAESWSPALKTTLRIMLANRFPQLLWWGPEHIQLYNDPYRPIPGIKHPDKALGQPAKECWAEIWHVIGPLVERPFSGGPATWDDDILLEIHRSDIVEETHFTIAYSPVPDDTITSGIGGVMATVHEITGKVVSDRRIVALRDLAARSAEAKTAEEACAIAGRTLAAHSKDVPFALLYLIAPNRHEAHLASSAGVEPDQSLSPKVIPLDENIDPDVPWPLKAALSTEEMQVVTNLAARFGSEVPRGPWLDPPTAAVVVPIRSNKAHHLAGLLVVGVSARLRLDEQYRDFLNLVSTQIATAIANAREYEEEKKRSEALAEIGRAKTTFFSNISHEFRTPLTLMLGPIEDLLAQRQAPLAPEVKTQLELAHRNSLRLLRLVNALLDFSRIEAGRVQAAFEPTDLAACTSDIASAFRNTVERAGLKFTVDCPTLSEPVYVDSDMWEKIVLNLISNAFKFTFEGEISVALREASGKVELLVRDTGVGIPAEEMPRLFERFHRIQTAQSRTHEGTGIGLALVQELVKLHGGTVGAESRLGVGSTFIVTLPLGRNHLGPERIRTHCTRRSTAAAAEPFVKETLGWLPQQAAVPRKMASTDLESRLLSPASGDQSEAERPRVLVADDNADMRQYLTRLLAEFYSVEGVPDGQAALELIRKRAPNLVLTDVMMPRMDGLSLVRELRTDKRFCTLPVIMVSARAGEDAMVEGLEEGVDDYLIKPFSARELLARVKAHLEMARVRKEAAQRIQQGEERFRALVTATCDAVYCMNPDWSKMLFLRGREFLADTEEPEQSWLQKYIHEEDQPQVLAAIHEAVRRKTLFELEHRVVRADGTPGWTFSRAVPLLNERGEVVEWFGAASDITARKEALVRVAADLDAMTRLQQIGTLFVSQGNLESVLGTIVEAAIAISGADFGNIQILDEGNSELRIAAYRGFRSDFIDFWERVVPARGASGSAFRCRERVIVEDVEKSPIFVGTPGLDAQRKADVRAVQSTPLLSRSGKALGVLSTHYRKPHRPDERSLQSLDLLCRQAADIMERAQIEKALQRSKEDLEQQVQERTAKLQELVAELEHFSYTITHDMHAPLRAMKAFGQMLKDASERRLNDKEKGLLQRIVTGAERMDNLISDALNYSKVVRSELALSPVDVGTLLRGMIETYPEFQEARCEIILDGQLPLVMGNESGLTQCFSNLIGNAVKFGQPGSRAQVRVWGERRGSWVRLWVEDNGIGISQEMLPRVFQMFSRGSSPQAGTGIGLALVRKVVDRMRGKVGVESELGKGSRFWVELRAGDEQIGTETDRVVGLRLS